MANLITEIKPQPGYQTEALRSNADIVIGGGAAGVGKTFTLLLESLRHTSRKGFGSVIFRRTSPMIRAEGGLWDASSKLYSKIDGATPRESSLQWMFRSGVKIKFSHLEYEKNVYDWQGSEIPMIGFDELTHFTKKMFFYLLSRNRSTCGVKPYIRTTCNPDPDSWVRELIDWWIGDDGFPINERSGVIRYFMRDNNNYIWGHTKSEVYEKGEHIIGNMIRNAERHAIEHGVKNTLTPDDFIKSLTFIGGSIYDNQELLKIDPNYLSNLNAQSKEEKHRLLEGNWNQKHTDEDVYKYKSFRDIFTNHYLEKTNRGLQRYITADIAMKGSDKFICFAWEGKMVIDFRVMPKTKGNEVIDIILEMAYKNNVPQSNIAFDNDGVGQYIDGFIEDAKEFNNGSRALNGENYKNLKSQCFIKSGDSVERNEYYIPPHIASMMYNPENGITLKEQMIKERKAVKRDKIDYDGKISVIPKHEMKVYLDGRSPDVMDAFMMREFFESVPDAPEVFYEI